MNIFDAALDMALGNLGAAVPNPPTQSAPTEGEAEAAVPSAATSAESTEARPAGSADNEGTQSQSTGGAAPQAAPTRAFHLPHSHITIFTIPSPRRSPAPPEAAASTDASGAQSTADASSAGATDSANTQPSHADAGGSAASTAPTAASEIPAASTQADETPAPPGMTAPGVPAPGPTPASAPPAPGATPAPGAPGTGATPFTGQFPMPFPALFPFDLFFMRPPPGAQRNNENNGAAEPAPAAAEPPAPAFVPQSLETWTEQREKNLGWRCDAVECLIAPPVPDNSRDESMDIDPTDEYEDDSPPGDKEMLSIYAPNQAPFPPREIGDEPHQGQNFVLLACEHRWHRACVETAERSAGHTLKPDAEGREWIRCQRCRKEGWIVPRIEGVPAVPSVPV